MLMGQQSSPARRALSIGAALVAASAALAGCGGGSSGSGPDGKTTLTVATFGDSSAIKRQAAAYEKDHPDITVKVSTAASSDDARTNLLTKLAAGTGLSDVEQIEISFTSEVKKYSSKFVPVEDDQYGSWTKSQAEPATAKGGKLFAYGAGTGPEAICYHADMLRAAGLPSDPASVSAMIGSWSDYLATGEKYAASGAPGAWMDSAYLVYNAQVEQMRYPYQKADDSISLGPEVEKAFKTTLETVPRLSAKLSPFSEDWNAGMGTNKYATMVCPSWLLSTIEGNSKGVTDWNIATTFPGGGGTVGGSYFVVPTQGEHQDEASKLAAYLTAPTQQIEAFKNGSAFPSRTKALDDPALLAVTNPFFNDAPVGTIYSDETKATDTVMYKGSHYLAIDAAALSAITRVENGSQSVDDAWTQLVADAKKSAKK